MENKLLQSRYLKYAAILITAGVVIFFSIKNLFFFDEDVFVLNTKSVFMDDLLQRVTTEKISYLIDNFFWKNNPLGYHITNWALHLINAMLALSVLKRFMGEGNHFKKLLKTENTELIFFILFLISPIHSEPLCYILGRDGLLVTFFCLLSILTFLKAGLKSKKYFFLSLLFFLLALLSYEISWTMPLMIIAIIIYCCYVKEMPVKKSILSAIPYFLLFAAWFSIKIIYLNKGTVTDYNDKELLNTEWLLALRNSAALFFRNFIPPFKNTVIFLTLSGILVIVLCLGMVKLYSINKPFFALALLLLTLTFLGFFPAALFGIDLHDSESERYIYFSSTFAIMLLALLLTTLIKSKQVLFFLVTAFVVVYTYSLLSTINFYNTAGNFSKKYLEIINEKRGLENNVYILNQPSQYQGALIFRAKTRMFNNGKFSLTTINEYFHYLYPADSTTYIRLSAYELQKEDKIKIVLDKPLDSIDHYFPFSKTYLKDNTIVTENGEAFPFNKNNAMVVAFKDAGLYFFK